MKPEELKTQAGQVRSELLSCLAREQDGKSAVGAILMERTLEILKYLEETDLRTKRGRPPRDEPDLRPLDEQIADLKTRLVTLQAMKIREVLQQEDPVKKLVDSYAKEYPDVSPEIIQEAIQEHMKGAFK